jgi:hypothetical protein
MSIWLLLIFVKAGYSGGLDHLEFASKAECEAAAVVVKQEFDSDSGWIGNVRTLCIEQKLL